MQLDLPVTLIYSFYVLVAWGLSATLVAFRILAEEKVHRAVLFRLGAVAWLGVPAYLAVVGTFWDFSASPPALMRLIAAMVLLVVLFSLSPWGRFAAERLPESLLVGTQVFRLPLEFLLYSLSLHLVISKQMTFSGYNFDVVTGALALPLWMMIRRGKAQRWMIWTWNILGLALLLIVMTIAVLSFPEPFGWFHPPNVVVASFPFVWLPTFLVPLALLSHLLIFRKLLLPLPPEKKNI